jgi:Tripartite tricarboxylate transporter TctB family
MSGPRRPRHLGELFIDLAIVVGSVLYLHAAQNYPPQGRQVPDVVGFIALGLGVLHLIAHAVPALWGVTHDSAARRREPAARVPVAVPAGASVGAGSPGDGVPEAPAGSAGSEGPGAADGETAEQKTSAPLSLRTEQGDSRQVLIAIAWVAGLLVGTYVLGYAVAIPVFFLAYFGAMRAWRTAIVSAIVMGVLTQGVFAIALAVPLPTGLFW